MSQCVEQRIVRVINNLLPATALEGKFGSPKTLYEQLAHYHTPGISIAVINDFEKDDTGNIIAMTLSQAGVMSLRQQADKQIRAERHS